MDGIDLSGSIPDFPASSGTPASMGGVPQVMPSNDWWKSVVGGAQDVIATAADIQALRRQNGIATPAGVVSSNAQNPAPGSKGLNFQAASTGGASVPGVFSGNTGLILGAVALVVVLAVLLKARA